MRKSTVFGITMLSLVLLMSLMPAIEATVYTWDGVNFVEDYEGEYIKYPHPDRLYYGISPYVNQGVDGLELHHHQVDSATSDALTSGAVVLCSAIGAIVASELFGQSTYTAVIGAVVGGGLGVYVKYVSELYFVDEEGCIWWWLSLEFLDWVYDHAYTLWYYGLTNPSLATAMVVAALYTMGYIRIGAITFLDAIGFGTPGPTRALTISASSGGTTNPPPGIHYYNNGVSVVATASEGDKYFGFWDLDGVRRYDNPITVTMDSDHNLRAEFTSGTTGGGECPTLFVWNSTDYASEGVLNIHAESDITVQHEIQNTLTLKGWVYSLELRELDNFTSHLDQVKLYAVDDQGEWHLSPLIHADHSELGWVTWKLRFDDSTRVDLKPTETTSLKFLPSIPYSETAYFVFEIDGYNRKAMY